MYYKQQAEKIWTIEGFLSPALCNDFIADFETKGFEEAKVSLPGGGKMMKGLRDNYRLSFEDEDLAQTLYHKLGKQLPVLACDQTARALYERFRVYRYSNAQRFKRHIDGRVKDRGRESRLSFLVYLNDGFKGGETKFDDAIIIPKQGTALLFAHEQKHESLPIETGVKYVLRSDVFYEGGGIS